jgi:Domain of unknown function (DUF4150)
MGMPIATKKSGFIAFAFPDVCKTPAPPSPTPVPIPYPNIGQLSDATNTSDSSTGTGEIKAGGDHVILAQTSEIPNTLGDQAGSAGGGVKSGTTGGKVEFTSGSKTVKVHGKEVVRMTDPTTQNAGNAVGSVLGGVPNILVGG